MNVHAIAQRSTRTLTVALALLCVGGTAAAQSAAPEEKPQTSTQSATQSAPKTYRLTYTVTEVNGTQPVGTQHYAMTLNPDGRTSNLKLGSKMPVSTGYGNSNQFQYIDIGLNISAHIAEFANGLQIVTKVEKTGMAEEQSPVQGHPPIVRQAMLENTAVVPLGKPVMLGSLDIPASTSHLDIGLVVELVR
jgi:hypothetical protein